jgi:hypothetical protein
MGCFNTATRVGYKAEFIKMKILNLYTSLSLLFLLLANRVSAQQKDYVVTRKNDTINCEIKLTQFGSYKYRLSKDSDYVKIKPDSILSFHWAKKNATFILAHLPDETKPQYAELLESGKITLVELSDGSGGFTPGVGIAASTFSSGVSMGLGFGGGGKGTRWYASKNNEPLKMVKTDAMRIGGFNKRYTAFSALIADDTDMVEAAKMDKLKDNYNFEIIRYYIHLYNSKGINPANK